MYDVTNPLSAISYTNKDFQTIYPELLETVKKLGQKWDPTISNESDPGVILIKLNAIIADKNNYNIDKNVLENYPETYTQEISARSQYRQLGYKMPWYRAAKTKVRFKWNKKDRELNDNEYVCIPRYTMVTDSDNDKIFTTLHDVTIGKINNGDGTGYADAIQGVITTLNIAGTENITLNHLDNKNRLYINDHYIAQNGIFVSNSSDIYGNLWEQVDNVEVQATGTPCYEFDVDARTNVCYLQFPDYIRDIIGSGLTIKYVITRGYEGNIGAKVINSLYEDVKSEIKMFGSTVEPVTLNNESLLLYNYNAATDGRDPEGIDEAYKSYKHVVGTFDTLVTLRDYMNAIYNSEIVSNVVVSDRTTDIQSSYKVLDKDTDAVSPYRLQMVSDSNTITYVKILSVDDIPQDCEKIYKYIDDNMSPTSKDDFNEKDNFYILSASVPYMSAFDLKYYLLKSGGSVSTLDEYDSTYDIDDSKYTLEKIQTFLDDVKSLQHDVKEIQKYEPFMLQNVYPIKLKIVPSYKLSELEMMEVRTNIQSTLRSMLHSRNVDFGAEPQYELIYDAISNCDNRIKVVMMDDFDYTTFAVYRDDDDSNGKPVFKKIPINNFNASNMIVINNDKTADEVNELFEREITVIKKRGNRPSDYFYIDLHNGLVHIYDKEELKEYSNQLLNIREKVFAKNVLAGVTPLYASHNKFKVGIDMVQEANLCVTSDKVTTSLEIAPFGYSDGENPIEYDPTVRDAEYTLGPNENLRFLAPSIITDKNYSSYVKYELVMKAPTGERNYVYANPDDEVELLRKYGINNFYVKDGSDKYVKVRSHNYKKLTVQEPEYRLDSYFYADAGYESLVALKPYNIGIQPSTVNTLDKFRYYTPKFEPNMYYHEIAGEYYVLNNEPNDWPNYGKYYKLKSFVPTYVEVAMKVDNLTNSDPNYIIYEHTDGEEYLVSKYDNSINYYNKSTREVVLLEPSECEEDVWPLTAINKELCVKENLINIDPTNAECYELITGQFSNFYTYEDGHYNMVYKGSELAGKTYHVVDTPNNWSNVLNSNLYGEVLYIKYVRNGVLYFDTISAAVPPFENEKYYTVNYSDGYAQYSKLSVRPSNWSDNYTSYFEQDDATEGLGLSSAEYDQWKKGILTLYVSEGTYKIPADTDYQLRDGDYITFFWREEDSDDAPYQFIRYNHIYDKQNNLPTIIRPNFTINASSYSNCIVNPQSDLKASSGVINYDAATKSIFQRIYLQLVKDYDLSGNKSIDLRKINSKALNYKNNMYFITKHVNEQEDLYELPMKCYSHASMNDGSVVAVYTYTLQDDEHFVYTNEYKDAFEVLSAGTLLKLTKTIKNLSDFDSTKEEVFRVKRVNISDVMYYGIDTFKDQCVAVSSSDNWLLIEQQIYSFTNGDTINIHLEDNFRDSFQQCTSNDINVYKDKTLYILKPDFTNIQPVYNVISGTANAKPCVPEFVYGKYYNSSHELLLSRPAEWPVMWPIEWPNGNDAWVNNYYELTGSSYNPVDKESIADDFITNYKNYFVRETQTYPVYNSNPSYVVDYTVQYKSGGSSFTNLPKINIQDDEYKWCVTAHLNMNMDNKNAQVINPYSHEEDGVTVYAKSHQQISTTNKVADITKGTDKLYVLSDVSIDKVGGDNVDVSYITSDSTEPVSVEFFVYSLNETFEQEPFGYDEYGNPRLSVAPNISSTFDIKNISLDNITDGQEKNFNYILPIMVKSSDISYSILAKGRKLVSQNSNKQVCGKGINYFVLSSDVDKITLKVNNSSSKTYKDGIVFQPLYKYRVRDIFTDEPGLSFENVLTTIREMDVEDCFKYDHTVDKSIEIDNPLLPASMFDNRHVYNHCTIAKAEIRMQKCNGSEVTFVNNK